jgi:hypothetical protein
MTAAPLERKWLIGAASDLAASRVWLQKTFPDGGWRLDLLGLEEDGAAAAGARIAVRCTFDRDADAVKFSQEYLAAESASPAAVIPPSQPPETEGDAAFADGARRILEGPQPIAAGKLHFVGLDKVRQHFGDKWPKLASRAETLVRRAIERRLSPQDVYRKTGDLNFVVMFANLDGREAELKCQLITEEIMRMLVGDEMGMLAVKTVATDVSGPEMLAKLGPAVDIAQAIEAEVEVRRLRREAPPTEAAASRVAVNDPLSQVEFLYRPIWDVKRSAVANFFLQAARPGTGNSRAVPITAFGDIELQLRFDQLVVDRVIADLQALHRQDRRLLISFPIHFESVSTPTRRTAILERWRSLPAECRKLGVFEILGAPDGVPQGRLSEIVNHLKMESRGTLMRVALGTVSFRNISDTGILAVGAELGARPGSEERVMAAFRDFVVNAEKARLVTYVHGLRSFSLTVGAIGAGFAYVDGDPVSSISERPEEAYRYGLDDLYAQRLAADQDVA